MISKVKQLAIKFLIILPTVYIVLSALKVVAEQLAGTNQPLKDEQ